MNEMSRAIIGLFRQGVHQAEIARRVGCTPANVSQTVRRHLGWNSTVTPLPPSYHSWLVKKAEVRSMPPADLAAELLMFVIDQIEGRK